MKLNLKVLTLGMLTLIPLLVVLVLSFGRKPREVPFMLLNKKAPEFSLTRLNGEPSPVSLKDYQGRALVINFWSTWCEPCRMEHPVLEWAAENLSEQASFIGIVYEDSEDNVRHHLAESPSRIPQLIDKTGKIAVEYGLSGVPETYFIDKTGMIQHKHLGPIDQKTLLAYILKLVQPGQD